MKLWQIITCPWKIISSGRLTILTKGCSDTFYLRCKYRDIVGEKLRLDPPVNFNEKIQWLKLYERKEIYTCMVDKYEAKNYVARVIGDEYIVPNYGVWERFDDICFDELPDQFVLKTTHDSASYHICKDKRKLDIESIRKRFSENMKNNFFYYAREWPYKNVKPRIIAEKFMEDSAIQELRDYKFFTFDGVPKIVHIVSNRQNHDEETYGDFFDMDYNHLNLTMGHNNAPVPPEKPKNFEKMKVFAEKLSEGTRHLRVDFYEVDGQLYFGELTFYQDSGFADIQPPEWNDILGSWISLD